MTMRYAGNLVCLVPNLTLSSSISVPVMCKLRLFFRKSALYSNDYTVLGLLWLVYLPHFSTGGSVASTQKKNSWFRRVITDCTKSESTGVWVWWFPVA